ncbi:MAG: hypothetical protein UR99_C0017G0024 [Candidatus Moranbacteria bacterium GW2011_GWD2_36_12]|nr:MAG: hypothetical protein UR99_C0017G0024 [Candidatus Moranbacteria bacterium GW2011_GWD2_36_12]
MQIIEIGANVFQNGTFLDDNIEGLGLSPSYKGHNYFKGKGAVMYPQPGLITIAISGSTLAHEMVASCLDPAYLGNDGYFVDNGGKFWVLDGDTLTYKQIDDTAGHTYNFGNVDIKVFNGDIFCTCDDDIVKLTNDMASIDKTWWTVTKGKSGLSGSFRHPMEIVEDTLYIADQDEIHTYDVAGVATSAWMTLPGGVNITALVKHPNGVYLMAYVSATANYSHSKKARAKLFIIDTTAGEFLQEIEIDDQVEGAINVGGINYVTYGDNFGYFNGQGLKLLKKIDFVSSPVYSQRLSAVGNTVLVPEFKSNVRSLMAYGDVNGKGNIFFYPYYALDTAGAYELKNMLVTMQNSIVLNYRDSTAHRMVRMDFTASTLTAGTTMLTAKQNLGGRVWVRRVDLFTETLASGALLTCLIRQLPSGSFSTVGTLDYSADGAISYKRLDCNILLSDLQLAINFGGSALVGLKKALVYVESE